MGFNMLFLRLGWLLKRMFYIISGFSIRIIILKSPHRAGKNGSCKKMEATFSLFTKFVCALAIKEARNVSLAGDERLCVLC